jgi:hypothetical protein
MKKTYRKPTLVKGPALSKVTATVCNVSPIPGCLPPV